MTDTEILASKLEHALALLEIRLLVREGTPSRVFWRVR